MQNVILDGLDSRHLFPTVLEAGKLKIKVTTRLSLLPVPWLDALSLSSQELFFACIWKEGGTLVSSSSEKDSNPILGVPL